MKITTFNPMILTAQAGDTIELFQALGFERRHQKTTIDERTAANVRMKDLNGFHVDVVQVDELPQAMTAIRMNVDDFDEGFALLSEHGFNIVQGGKVTDTGSSKSVMMISPSGFGIVLEKHIRKD